MTRSILIVALFVFPLSATVSAQAPQTISYQGVLTDDAGLAVADGTYNMTFRLYEAASGGTSIWEETLPVNVTKGLFNVILGSGTPFKLSFDEQFYLGISVEGEAELSPRVALTAAPYSIHAFDSDYLNGQSSTAFSLSGHNHDTRYYMEDELNLPGTINDTSNPVDWTKLKNVPAGFADGTDNVGGSGDGHSLDAADGLPSDVVYVDNDGNVGIGTTSPTEKFHLFTPGTQVYLGKSTEAVRGEHVMSGAYGSLGLVNTGVSGYSLGLYGVLGSTHTGYGVYGGASGTEGHGVYGYHISGNYGILGADNEAVYGHYAGNGNNGQLGGSYFGVRGESATGYAGYFAGKLFTTAFEMPIGAAAGRVLTSDASGNGTWQPPPSGIGGSGSANYIPRFTASNTLGNPEIYQSAGNNVGISTPNPGSKLEVNGMCRIIGVVWPSGGEGLELGYNPAINRAYIQSYDRNTSTAGELCLVLGMVGIGTCAPEAMLHVDNSADNTLAKIADGSHGVWAENTTSGNKGYVAGAGYGLYGESGNVAVRGSNPAPGQYYGELGGSDFGVKGYNLDHNNYALLAWGHSAVYAYNPTHGQEAWLCSDDYGAYIDGDVVILGALTKPGGSFKIDHPLDPENKYLYHSFIESPDMMNVYNGNVILDERGEAWIDLPEWFEALNKEYRYQLTCIGGYAPVYIAEKISGNRFEIAGGSPGLEVSWQMTGIRHDPYAEQHRIPVEEEKAPQERGRCLHPDLYGLPESMKIKPVNSGIR
jgi:hypothetical protein